MKTLFTFFVLLISITGSAQLVNYPSEVRYFSFSIESKPVKMAYMDIPAANTSNDKVIVLLHGKNFNGYYWKNLLPFLTGKGYRIVIPDQVGWGRSSKPDIHYSFHMLAANTKKLLDTLGIKKAIILGHSMGGMLATRFALMFPDAVNKLILENPIGLEDYKTFVPYRPIEISLAGELKATYESYKKYQQSYYPAWKPEYEQYVQAQAESLNSPDFYATALANALTYQMIYEQPVIYEFKNIKVPTLLVIGQSDRTIVGKDQLTEEAKMKYGNYPVLGKQTHEKIPGSQLKGLPGIGHIPHIQDIEAFKRAIEVFL